MLLLMKNFYRTGYNTTKKYKYKEKWPQVIFNRRRLELCCEKIIIKNVFLQ